MDISLPFIYSGIKPTPSVNGQYIAYVTEKGLKSSKLVIRHSETLATKHIINLDEEFSNNLVGISWCNGLESGLQPGITLDSIIDRLVIASRHKAIVIILSNESDDVYDVKLLEGISASVTSITDILWVNKDHILVWSEQSMDVSIWCVFETINRILKLGGIAKPKTSTKADLLKWTQRSDSSYAYLFLSRSEARDELVSVFACKTSFFSERFSIPDFVDLQAPISVSSLSGASSNLLKLSFSPFIVLHESAFLGYIAGFWFLDANLTPYFVRRFTRWPQSVYPSTAGVNFAQLISSDLVMLADDEENVTMLSALLNFEPVKVFQHGTVIPADTPGFSGNTVVWGLGSNFKINNESRMSNTSQVRGIFGSNGSSINEASVVSNYDYQKLPFFPRQSEIILKGVFLISTSPSGKYIASVVKHMPSTVWIWNADQQHSMLNKGSTSGDGVNDETTSRNQHYGILYHNGPVAVLDHSDRVHSLIWRDNYLLDNIDPAIASKTNLDALLIFMPQCGSVSIWSPHGIPMKLGFCTSNISDSFSTLVAPLRGVSWMRSTIDIYQLAIYDSRSLAFAAVSSGLEAHLTRECSGSLLNKNISSFVANNPKLKSSNFPAVTSDKRTRNAPPLNPLTQKKNLVTPRLPARQDITWSKPPSLIPRPTPLKANIPDDSGENNNQTYDEEYETSEIRRKRHGTSTASMVDAHDNDPVAKYLIRQVQQQAWMQGNDSINSEDPGLDLDDTFAFKRTKPNEK